MTNINKELVLNILSKYIFEIKKDIVTFKSIGYSDYVKPYDDKIKINENHYSVNPYYPIRIEKQFNKFCEFFFGHVLIRIQNILDNTITMTPEIKLLFEIEYDPQNGISILRSKFWTSFMKKNNNDTLLFLKKVKEYYDILCQQVIKECSDCRI